MTDQRFYVVALLLFGVFVIGAILFLNVMQPAGVDVEIWNRITTPATTIIGLLVLLINSNVNRQKVEGGQKEIKQEIHAAPQEIKQAAVVAKDKIEYAAAVAAKQLVDTASSLAREKGKS